MSRRSVKDSLKTLLEGVAGVKKVYRAKPKIAPQQYLPAIVIQMPDTSEQRASAPAGTGKKRIHYTIQLQIWWIDPNADPETGELTFDDFLDAIDTKLRSDHDLSDTVLLSGEQIRTSVAEPIMVEGQNVGRVAVKEFTVLDEIVG